MCSWMWPNMFPLSSYMIIPFVLQFNGSTSSRIWSSHGWNDWAAAEIPGRMKNVNMRCSTSWFNELFWLFVKDANSSSSQGHINYKLAYKYVAGWWKPLETLWKVFMCLFNRRWWRTSNWSWRGLWKKMKGKTVLLLSVWKVTAKQKKMTCYIKQNFVVATLSEKKAKNLKYLY